MKLHFLILSFILFFSHLWLNSQENSYSIPQVLMPEPSAAEFIRQEAYPVSNHTGSATVTVPIYTVRSGDIEIPITATYNTGGIKVNQEASWIGLGWNLNVGGMITRVINGNDDLGEQDGHIGRIFDKHININSVSVEDYITPTCFFNKTGDSKGGNQLFYERLLRTFNRKADLEPDYFYFNFGKYSGKFLLQQPDPGTQNFDPRYIKSPLVYGDRAIDIRLIRNEEVTGLGRFNFLLTDIDGTKYYYNTVETSASDSFEVDRNSPTYDPNASWYTGAVEDEFNKLFTSSTWHLNTIESIKGDVIHFEYKEKTVINTPNTISFVKESHLGDWTKYNHAPSSTGNYKTIYSGAVKEQIVLSKIRFKNGEINFHTEQRKDLRINNYFSDNIAQRLTKIEVKNTTTDKIIQEIDFIQDYFNFPGQINESIIDPDLARLKLDSIVIRDVNSKEKKPYGFTYYLGRDSNNVLPSKESFAQDYWGFFNGQIGNRHLLPSIGFNGANHHLQNGANRYPRFEYTKRAALESVSYPTKGTTTFEYGPNLLDYREAIVPDTYAENIVMAQESSERIKAYLYYVANDSIEVNWNVEFSTMQSPCGLSGSSSTNNSNQESDALGNAFSAIIYSPSNTDLSFMDHYYNNIPNSDRMIELTDENDLHHLELYLELDNKNTNVVYDEITNDERSLLCNHSTVYRDHTLKLKKGWHIICARKPREISRYNPKLYAELFYPNSYKLGVYKKYGPGLRIERQILDTGNQQEVTNYTYKSGKFIPELKKFSDSLYGHLIGDPQFTTRYNVAESSDPNPKTYISPPPIETVKHITSSNNIGHSGAISNTDVVGYGKVVVTKSNTEMQENGKSIYYYIPNRIKTYKHKYYKHRRVPQNLTYDNDDLLFKEEHYNNDDVLLSSKQYDYEYFDKGSVAGVKYVHAPSVHPRSTFFLVDENTECYETLGIGPFFTILRSFYFQKYNLNVTATLPKRITETTYFTNGELPIETVMEYKYDQNYLLPIQNTTYISNNSLQIQKNITYTKYPFMYDLGSINTISRMALPVNNVISLPIEVQHWESKGRGKLKLLGGQYTEYDQQFSPKTLYSIRPLEMTVTPTFSPIKTIFKEEKTTGWTYHEELRLEYDRSGNLSKAQKLNAKPVEYVWAYNETYPVIKAENTAEIAKLSLSLLPSEYNTLDDLMHSLQDIATNTSQQQRWRKYNDTLRAARPQAMITTYTYAPLIGITSKTDSRGYTVYYEYDALNRVKRVKDADGNIVSESKYNYKN